MPTFIFDDVYGDLRPGAPAHVPTYLPPTNQWDPLGGTCPQCTLGTNLPIPIDPTRAQNGTWHTVSVNPEEPTTTVSITFIGTAVTAYCMLPPYFSKSITSYMNMTFELDGRLVGSYEKTATTNQWTYNYPVYNITGLENTAHTFVIQPRGGESNSYMVFDYFTYEYEEPPTSDASSIPPTKSTASTSPAISAQSGLSLGSAYQSGSVSVSGYATSRSTSTSALAGLETGKRVPQATPPSASKDDLHKIGAMSKAATAVGTMLALAALIVSLVYIRRRGIRLGIRRRDMTPAHRQNPSQDRLRPPSYARQRLSSTSASSSLWDVDRHPSSLPRLTNVDTADMCEDLEVEIETISRRDGQQGARNIQIESLIVELRSLGVTVAWEDGVDDVDGFVQSEHLPSYLETIRSNAQLGGHAI